MKALFRDNIPSFIKPFIRFIFYKEERARFFREPSIRRQQNELIKKYDKKAGRIILFLIAGANRETGTDAISGGILSIVSICEESAALKYIHGAEVIMSTFPDEFLLAKHTQFNNNTPVFRFQQLKLYFRDAEEVQVHLPEFLCAHFIQLLNAGKLKWFSEIKNLRINILNQNILLMPSLENIRRLEQIAYGALTITTAHQRYCNQRYREIYGVPLHKFSVWISPEKYFFKEFSDKENLIVVSPDDHPMREEIMKMLTQIENLEVIVIQNLTYEQYKLTISRAKWVLTFGEGLDGYIIESIFSGAVGFAVYNKDFFTQDFEEFPTIYTAYRELKEKIVLDIARLNEESIFKSHQENLFRICAKYYSQKEYSENIKKFYLSQYTYP